MRQTVADIAVRIRTLSVHYLKSFAKIKVSHLM